MPLFHQIISQQYSPIDLLKDAAVTLAYDASCTYNENYTCWLLAWLTL
jgi:hypothetical protein